MLKLEDLKSGMRVDGLVPGVAVTVRAVEKVGDNALTVLYKPDAGTIGEVQLFREDEARLSVAQKNLPWTFDAPAKDFKRALEALRIQLGCRFDPMMAIHSSNVIPLPHQIAAVYQNMLPISPLRYVLADDPGAGKTVMAGLLIKELLMRADAARILIVSPGSLTEQWQTELSEKFTIDFRIFSREAQNQSPSGNFFQDEDLVIARLDQLSRIDDFQDLLKRAPEWDLVIIDEAHKLSAHAGGEKTEKTKRYRLGELLGRISRHFLMMTATPHNGKDGDFQAWLQLLDPDRFYGVTGAGGGPIQVDETIMRRMVKEDLLKFDGTRLFPKRIAQTISYHLTGEEEALYNDVTSYVVHGWNQAQQLANPKMRSCIGFALTMLQRRLASSPEAIYQSLHRRRERLEAKLEEVKTLQASHGALPITQASLPNLPPEDLPDSFDDFDEEDMPDGEVDGVIDQLVDNETASLSPEALQEEVDTLSHLEAKAAALLSPPDHQIKDVKWQKLSALLQDNEQMFDANGQRRKIIIFTEHRDTLNYLQRRIAGVLGNTDAVKTIHGGTNRELRREIQEKFNFNPDVQVLIATDAAGEGVNLHQNCNLMVNYDLPWNPCRLEQRFGRIHRIGQTQPCFLWNLVAVNTREGQVFERLFQKIHEQEEALEGRVFDILGAAFEETSLKDMLLKAIMEGENPETKAWMTEKVDSALDYSHLKAIIDHNALVDQTMSPDMIYKIKEDMERAQAKKLQPCFVRSFLLDAMEHLGAVVHKKANERYELPHVPSAVQLTAKELNPRRPVSDRYEYICFDKENIRPSGATRNAEFVHAGHPLVNAVTDIVLKESRPYLKAGTVMVNPNDEGTEPYLLFMIDHSVSAGGEAERHKLSREIQFVRMSENSAPTRAGWAPHLDLTPADGNQTALSLASAVRQQGWISGDLEAKVLAYAADNVVKEHYETVKKRHLARIEKLHAEIYHQLTKAINFYSAKYVKLQEEASKPDAPALAKANAESMRRRIDDLRARLSDRETKLAQERNVFSEAPVVQGGIIVIPQGLLDKAGGGQDGTAQSGTATTFCADAEVRRKIEQAAMKAVMAAEKALGNTVEDVSAQKVGWDVTSRRPTPSPGQPILEDRLIEVKGKGKGSDIVTISHNEICTAVNLKDKFILAIVIVDGDEVDGPYYVKDWVDHEPEPGQASINYQLSYLLEKAKKPEEVA